MRVLRWLPVLLLAALPAAAQTSSSFARPELLVDPAWLAVNLFAPDTRVVDLRPRGFDEGHIPGAILLPLYLAQATVAMSLPITAVTSIVLQEHLRPAHWAAVGLVSAMPSGPVCTSRRNTASRDSCASAASAAMAAVFVSGPACSVIVFSFSILQ